ncbi:ATP-binding protein [Porphyrobacter sp. CACIAM 03H1]|jgi:signal transduction histidine kinase/CheY-like chemotaxis protein|uniref:ATP-binding protein n=1 Tax=Porphyrobacter sp. CACIAM 03H1 TaxID=2003315 RepID=UPI000B5ABCD3|nr:ATP-binding protein [Porphyrobacter sp. CACIAM 03H1]ASJ90531.1 hybrid sensor histidine kinase/response regulator [Porphyrobacter sp. CACIAM 03H1]
MTATLESDEIARLKEQVRKLEAINAALMDRVERASDLHGGAFSMFENAITLEAMVRGRTNELEDAMVRLATINAQIEAARNDADAARARLRDAIESLSDGFALFDAEDRLVMCNTAFLAIWPEFHDLVEQRPSFADLVDVLAGNGSAVGSLVAPERWKQERLARHRNAGAHVQLLSDGRWLQINELRTSEGGTVSIYTDITSVKAEDARQRARELAERNLALQSTLDTLSEGACLFGPNGQLQAWNDELANMLHLNRDVMAVIGTHGQFVQHCISRCRLDRPQAVEWREGRGPRISTDCMLGSRNFVIRSVTLASGGMAFAFDDVTDRIRFQKSMTEVAETLERAVKQRTAELVEVNRQLAEAKDEAELANLSKTRFLAAASHDLLQPLNAARLFVSALHEKRLAASTRGLVGQASIALDSVEDLLESLFEISRLDAGAIQPEIRTISLDRMLSALRIEFAPLARSRGLAFSVAETGLHVSSDVQMLRRVLQNLVSNAIRYTAAGSVTVSAQREGDRVTVAVTDTGPGIAAGEQRVVFEEFRRLEATRKIPGHGLGLAIVRRSCAKLGHGVALDSAPGRGSTFSVTLPAADADVAAAATVAARGAKTAPASGAILVIDNDEAILAGMRALLENWGHRAITAVGPDRPEVRAAAEAGLSLMLADYHLEDGLTGDIAVARVRAMHKGDLPAAIVTADRSEEVRASLAAQGLPVLGKPIKPAQLRALLRQLAVPA